MKKCVFIIISFKIKAVNFGKCKLAPHNFKQAHIESTVPQGKWTALKYFILVEVCFKCSSSLLNTWDYLELKSCSPVENEPLRLQDVTARSLMLFSVRQCTLDTFRPKSFSCQTSLCCVCLRPFLFGMFLFYFPPPYSAVVEVTWLCLHSVSCWDNFFVSMLLLVEIFAV